MSHLALVPEDKSEWLRCRPWIVEALEYGRGRYTIEGVEKGIEERRYRFFSSPNAAVVVQIAEYETGEKVLCYFLGGGDLNELKYTIHPAVSAWAKSLGCTSETIVGRGGWVRAVADLGFKPGWRMVYKEL